MSPRYSSRNLLDQSRPSLNVRRSDHVSPAVPASQTAQIPKIESGNSQIIGDTVDRDLEQGSITDPTVLRRHKSGDTTEAGIILGRDGEENSILSQSSLRAH
jgi:hypothetical protein